MRLTRLAAINILYLMTSLVVAYTARPGANTDVRHSVLAMVDGTADKPFIYRALMGMLTRLIDLLIPQRVSDRIDRSLEHGAHQARMQSMFDMLVWDRQQFTVYVIVFGLQALCFYGFALVIRALVKNTYALSEPASTIIPIIALLVLPAFFLYGLGYIYDPATICLFSLGLWAIYANQRCWFLAILALASLNRETACLLIMYSAIYDFRAGRTRLIERSVLPVAIYLAIQLGLRGYYQSATGSALEHHLMLNWSDYFLFANPTGALYLIVMIGGFGLALALGWALARSSYKMMLLLTLLILVPLWVVSARMAEIGTFFEVYPLVVLILAPLLEKLLHGEFRASKWSLPGEH